MRKTFFFFALRLRVGCLVLQKVPDHPHPNNGRIGIQKAAVPYKRNDGLFKTPLYIDKRHESNDFKDLLHTLTSRSSSLVSSSSTRVPNLPMPAVWTLTSSSSLSDVSSDLETSCDPACGSDSSSSLSNSVSSSTSVAWGIHIPSLDSPSTAEKSASGGQKAQRTLPSATARRTTTKGFNMRNCRSKRELTGIPGSAYIRSPGLRSNPSFLFRIRGQYIHSSPSHSLLVFRR